MCICIYVYRYIYIHIYIYKYVYIRVCAGELLVGLRTADVSVFRLLAMLLMIKILHDPIYTYYTTIIQRSFAFKITQDLYYQQYDETELSS